MPPGNCAGVRSPCWARLQPPGERDALSGRAERLGGAVGRCDGRAVVASRGGTTFRTAGRNSSSANSACATALEAHCRFTDAGTGGAVEPWLMPKAMPHASLLPFIGGWRWHGTGEGRAGWHAIRRTGLRPRGAYPGTLQAWPLGLSLGLDSLTDARAAGALSRRLRVLTHPALLVVDEIGYLPVSQDGAVLFFQLINARHERASTVLTSNKGFEEWGHVLGDEVMAAALIDRLLHHWPTQEDMQHCISP